MKYFVSQTTNGDVFGPFAAMTEEESRYKAQSEFLRRDTSIGNFQMVEIAAPHQLYHCYLIDQSPAEWKELCNFVETCFDE